MALSNACTSFKMSTGHQSDCKGRNLPLSQRLCSVLIETSISHHREGAIKWDDSTDRHLQACTSKQRRALPACLSISLLLYYCVSVYFFSHNPLNKHLMGRMKHNLTEQGAHFHTMETVLNWNMFIEGHKILNFPPTLCVSSSASDSHFNEMEWGKCTPPWNKPKLESAFPSVDYSTDLHIIGCLVFYKKYQTLFSAKIG